MGLHAALQINTLPFCIAPTSPNFHVTEFSELSCTSCPWLLNKDEQQKMHTHTHNLIRIAVSLHYSLHSSTSQPSPFSWHFCRSRLSGPDVLRSLAVRCRRLSWRIITASPTKTNHFSSFATYSYGFFSSSVVCLFKMPFVHLDENLDTSHDTRTHWLLPLKWEKWTIYRNTSSAKYFVLSVAVSLLAGSIIDSESVYL